MILTRQLRSRRPVALVGLAAAGLVLSGCGSSLGIHPGSAAVIGDETLSMSKIDDTSTLVLHGVRRAVPVLPAAAVRTPSDGLVPQLRRRQPRPSGCSAEQLADQYGVQPAPGYQQAVTQYEQALASSPADERDAAIEVAGADAYLQNVQVAVGQQLHRADSGQSNADLKAALERGRSPRRTGSNDHDAFIDPVFGISVDDGAFTAAERPDVVPRELLRLAGCPARSQTPALRGVVADAPRSAAER